MNTKDVKLNVFNIVVQKNIYSKFCKLNNRFQGSLIPILDKNIFKTLLIKFLNIKKKKVILYIICLCFYQKT